MDASGVSPHYIPMSGTFQYVNNRFNYLSFNYNVMLTGGQYLCKNMREMMISTPSSKSLEICLEMSTDEETWKDFEVLLMNEYDVSSSYNFGNVSINTDGHVRSKANSKIPEYLAGHTIVEAPLSNNVSFNQICILNSCRQNGLYCSFPYTFVGSLAIEGFITSFIPESNKLEYDCSSKNRIRLTNSKAYDTD